jgi:hypothetical protein
MNPVFKAAIRSLERPSQSIDSWLLDAEVERGWRESFRNSAKKPPCTCSESYINGTRQPMPLQHSCEYAAARSKLVDTAVALANSSVLHDSARWTRVFNTEMERLARPLLE